MATGMTPVNFNHNTDVDRDYDLARPIAEAGVRGAKIFLHRTLS